MAEAIQTTISKPIIFEGVGVHSGEQAHLVIKPGEVGSGIVFRRVDLMSKSRPEAEIEIYASPLSVAGTELGTRLENAVGVAIATVEHLMAAFSLCGVTNALVDCSGPEAPILDGSAKPFLDAIIKAGLTSQGERSIVIAPKKEVSVTDGDRSIVLTPSDRRLISVRIEFPDEAIGAQTVTLDLDAPFVTSRVAAARTFCRLEEIERLRAAGFCLGGALDNAIVVDRDRILNEGGLRDEQEFALHKALDLIGDLYLLGAPLVGEIKATKPGHDLNTRFARELVAQLVGSTAKSNAQSAAAL
ncbi:MAG: UDP-3-O-acyl-N-acetylglucosamine deacetylase [Pseudomonadota bacterium]